MMTNRSWKITTYEDGSPAGSAEGLNHEQAVAAIRGAMYGHDPLTEGTSFGRALSAVKAKRQDQPVEQRVPVAA
jgi:hypothetical protein